MNVRLADLQFEYNIFSRQVQWNKITILLC